MAAVKYGATSYHHRSCSSPLKNTSNKSIMESFSTYLSISPHFPTLSKTLNSSPIQFPICNSTPSIKTQNHRFSTTRFLPNNSLNILSKPTFIFLGLSFPLSSIASEITTTVVPIDEGSGKINLESILVSIDSFFNRYPFFVTTVAFIWLIAIPLSEEYLQKYRFVSAVNAFKKLKEVPGCQLLDIRESKSLDYLGSPNLKLLGKTAINVEFREGDEDGFVKRVLEKLGEPASTTVCILDNFDGNSMKVAELLVKSGYKEAYAVRGGIRGKNGWQEIQENLLPPSVHIYPKESTKTPKQLDTVNGGIQQPSQISDEKSSTTNSSVNDASKEVQNRDFSSVIPTIQSTSGPRSSSPYSMYPDCKPPSSPTPSKPN